VFKTNFVPPMSTEEPDTLPRLEVGCALSNMCLRESNGRTPQTPRIFTDRACCGRGDDARQSYSRAGSHLVSSDEFSGTGGENDEPNTSQHKRSTTAITDSATMPAAPTRSAPAAESVVRLRVTSICDAGGRGEAYRA